MSMSHLKSLSPHVILLSLFSLLSVPVISDDHCCISHLKLQGWGGGCFCPEGIINHREYFIYWKMSLELEDEPIVGEGGLQCCSLL